MEMAGAGGSLSGRVLSNGSVKATGYMGSNYGAASGRVSSVVPAAELARSYGKRELRGVSTAPRRSRRRT